MTRRDFAEWLNLPVTQKIFEELRKAQQEIAESILAGAAITERSDETAIRHARLIGEYNGLREATEYVPEWAKEQEDEGQGEPVADRGR